MSAPVVMDWADPSFRIAHTELQTALANHEYVRELIADAICQLETANKALFAARAEKSA